VLTGIENVFANQEKGQKVMEIGRIGQPHVSLAIEPTR